MAAEGGDREDMGQLVRDARRGGRAEFDRLARRCLDRIRRWALTVVGDPDDADDVTQATLVRLHRYLDSYDGTGSFDAWLYRVTRNAALDRESSRPEPARGERASVDRLTDTATDGALAGLYAEELTGLVAAFYRELPPRQRQVFDLADLQGYRPAEIAEMLELNPSTVRANLFKARKAIRGRILRDHPELEEGYHRGV